MSFFFLSPYKDGQLKRPSSAFFLHAVALLMMVGCGFHPARHQQTRDDFLKIWVDTIPNREGQVLRNALINQLYGGRTPDPHPRFILKASLAKASSSIGFDRQSTVVRRKMTGTLTFEVQNTHTRQVCLKGQEIESYSYTVSGDNPQLNILSTETQHMVHLLARRLILRLTQTNLEASTDVSKPESATPYVPVF